MSAFVYLAKALLSSASSRFSMEPRSRVASVSRSVEEGFLIFFKIFNEIVWEIVLYIAKTYWNLSTLTIWLPLTPAKKSSMPSFRVEDSSANSPEPWRKK